MMRRLAGCLLLGLFLPACSAPPEKERQQAEGALQAARAAGAEQYAPTEFNDAQSALSQYDAAVSQRDYRQALNHALEARDMAYEAARQTANRKAELRSQAEHLVDEAQALIASASARLAGSGGRLNGAASTRLRVARDFVSLVLQEARTQLAREDYAGAVRKLGPAVARLQREDPKGPSAPAKRKK